MKRIASLLTLIFGAFCMMAQTPGEIVSRMEEVMGSHQSEGVYMTVDVRVPLLGTISTRTWMRDDRVRLEAKMMGIQEITWMTDTTEWSYNTGKNEVEIKSVPAGTGSSSDADISMFSELTASYDFAIQKETPDAWQIRCTRRKGVEDKDSPKNMTLIVSKASFLPLSLSFKTSGVNVTMHDIAFGVSLSQVTFNPADYPEATVIDKR